VRERLRLGSECERPVAAQQDHPAVLAPQRTRADPHQLAGRAELVEHARVVVEDAGGQDPRF
jgi:hypothetical protein